MEEVKNALNIVESTRFDDLMPIAVKQKIDETKEEMRKISHAACMKLDCFIPLTDEAGITKLFSESDMILMFHEGVSWAREEDKIV